MKSEYLRITKLLVFYALFMVPSLAFAGEGDEFCYKADLESEGLVVGVVKLTGTDNKYTLEVEIEDFPQSGDFEVRLFKDYYSDFLAAVITVDENGDGKAVFQIPYPDPDFKVIIGDSVVSGEWVECEMPTKPVQAKITPSVLNLRSNGKYVTVKVSYPFGDETPMYIVIVVNGETIEPSMVSVSSNHIILKFSRTALQENCDIGDNTIIIAFKLGELDVELSETIKVIYEGEKMEQVQAKQKTKKGNSKLKSNNGKSFGKKTNKK